MAPLPATSYLQAWLDHDTSCLTSTKNILGNEAIYLRDSGFVIARSSSLAKTNRTNHLIVNLHKGGILKYYDDLGPIASDTGICAELKNGTILVSHNYKQNDFSETNYNDEENISWVCNGRLHKRSSNLLTPFKGLIFRLWCLSLGRMFPNATRKIIQKIAITGKKITKYKFKRVIAIKADKVEVCDYLPVNMPIKRLSIGSDATSIYVAGSLSLHESRLCPWQNIQWEKLPILEGKKVWRRSYFRGSGHSHLPGNRI